jgi:hypothetical protein
MTTPGYPDLLPRRSAAPSPRPRSIGVPSQLLFRELNEEIALKQEPPGASDEREIDVVCECQSRSCAKELRIPLGRYEAVRRFPTRFVMKPGHATAGDERIVEEGSGFVVVEKIGPGARVAIRLDPRRRRRPASQAA